MALQLELFLHILLVMLLPHILFQHLFDFLLAFLLVRERVAEQTMDAMDIALQEPVRQVRLAIIIPVVPLRHAYQVH